MTPAKFYSSSLELSPLQTHIIVYTLGCRSRISIKSFFQIWIWSIQIDFIAIFLFERFHTRYDEWLPVVLKTSAMRFPFISWSNFEFEWRLGLTFTSRRITEPVRSSIISNPNSSKQFPWEAQCLWTCCTMWPSAAINVFSTTSKNLSFSCQNHENNIGGAE